MTETDPRPSLVAATIDCADVERLAAFYTELLGVELRGIHGEFGFLTAPRGGGIAIWLQRVPEAAAGKTRVHLDFAAADLDATLNEVRRLGGTVGGRHEWEGYVWNQCFDPEGNVFDVMQAPPSPDES